MQTLNAIWNLLKVLPRIHPFLGPNQYKMIIFFCASLMFKKALHELAKKVNLSVYRCMLIWQKTINNDEKVRHLDHVKSKFIGVAHSNFNFKAKQPVLFLCLRITFRVMTRTSLFSFWPVMKAILPWFQVLEWKTKQL